MEPPSLLNLIIIAASILAVAVLSSSESSIIAVNKLRIRTLKDKGDKRAQAAHRLLEKHDKLFSAVVLSGNLFTILATSMGTALAVNMLGEDYGVITATVLMTFLTAVFGELAPKTFAVTHSEKVTLFLAKPLELYIKAISPLIWVFNSSSNLILRMLGVKERPSSPFVTEEEIKALLKIGKEEGTIEEEERKMLHRVFEFGDKMVSEAMVPRTEIVAIPENATIEDAVKLVSGEGYSRYPVIKESIDNITGLLYIKDMLMRMPEAQPGMPISDLMREAYYIPESKMVSELLDEMQKKKFHIAIVVDEYGGTAGLITLEDIIEEIVGGLQDEFEALEAEKDIEIIDERTSIVSGQTGIDEINELIGARLASEGFHTIGGFVFGLFGRLPRVGEQVRYHNLRFLILEMEDRKISKIKITRL
ncbi:MAG: hemolysin family protein [Thermodesulfovibrionales bacterium]|nr:hemolysin family protein [Thermodesulfovibrionales bacterium]